MANKIQLRRDTAENWASEDPILSQGEPGYDLTNKILKIGNGTAHWSELDPVGASQLPPDAQGYLINDGDGNLSWGPGDGTFSGDYNDLTNAPTIPTDVNQLTDVDGLLGGGGGGRSDRLVNGDLEVVLDNKGTLTTPLLLPKSFTAVLDSAHSVQGVDLTGSPWEYTVEFQVSPNGIVETMVDNPAHPSNPGYSAGKEFVFTESEHGIPDYTFTLTLTDVQNPGPMMYTANIAVSPPPAYPPTIYSDGAVKISSNENEWTFGTDGNLTIPFAGTIGDNLGQLYVPNVVNIGNVSLAWIDPEQITEETPAPFSEWSDNGVLSAVNDLVIATNLGEGQTTPEAIKSWTFGADGKLTLPIDSDILDSDGNSVLVNLGNLTIDGSEITSSDDYITIKTVDGYAQIESQNELTGSSYVWVEGGQAHIETPGGEWVFGLDGSTVFPNDNHLVSDNLSIEGDNLALKSDNFSIAVYPSTIVLTGADHAPCNGTYILEVDSSPLTWYKDGNNTNQQYIVYDEGWTAITEDINSDSIYVNSGKLYSPNAQWELGYSGGPAPTGTYTFIQWNFDSESNLTLPAGGDIVDVNGNSVLPQLQGKHIVTRFEMTSVDNYTATEGDWTTEAGPAAMLKIADGSVDDANISTGTLPFNISFNDVSYDQIYIGSNSYLTFGGGSNRFNISGPGSANAHPAIFISSADNSYQRIYKLVSGTAGTRSLRIRFEGTNNTGGEGGNSNIIWEAVFYENIPNTFDIIVLKDARDGGGVTGISNGTSWIQSRPTIHTSLPVSDKLDKFTKLHFAGNIDTAVVDGVATITIPLGGGGNQGVAAGGTTGQVLAKIDSTDYNTEWVDQTDLGSFTIDNNAIDVANGIDIYIETREGGGSGESRLVLKPQDDNGGTNPTRIEGSYGVGIWSNTTDSGNEKKWLFGSDGRLTLPAGGDIVDSNGNSVLGGDGLLPPYKGFRAHYGSMYDNNDDPNGPINKLVIYKSTVTPTSAIDTDTSSDDFQVTGLTGSDVVAMLVVVSDNITQTSLADLKTFVEAIIDEVILDEGVEGDFNNINAIRTAFYDNFSNFNSIIPSVKTGLEFFDTEPLRYYMDFGQAVNSGSGAGLNISTIEWNPNNNNFDATSYSNGAPGGYQVGDTITIPGTAVRDYQNNYLASPANDITITINSVDGGGIAQTYTITGTVPYTQPLWPVYSIDDGGDDEYDGANAIHTNLETNITYNSGAPIINSTAFGGGDYVVTYQAGIFGIFATGANIDVIGTSGEEGGYGNDNSSSGFDGDGVAVTGSLYGNAAPVESPTQITNTDGNNTYSVSVGTDGVVTMTTSRGNLEFGALPEPGGTQHFHIMRPGGETDTDLFFGDDFNYVRQRPAQYQQDPAYGVEIGTNDNNGGDQHVWRFETDGKLTLPNGGILSDTPSAETVTLDQLTDISGWAGTLVFTKQNTTTYQALPDGPLMSLVGSDWVIQYDATGWFSSTDLVTWVAGPWAGTTPPVGTLSAATTTLTVNSNDWKFGDDGVLTIPDGGIVGGPVGTNKIDLSWDVSIISGKSIRINSGSGGVVSNKFWTFSEDTLILPAGSLISDEPIGERLTLSGAGLTAVNQTYTKTSATLYTGGNGVTIEAIGGGVWFCIQGGDTKYSSTDNLITWDNSTGGLPVPTSTLSAATTTLTVDNKEWKFDEDGKLTLPAGGDILNSSGQSVLQGIQGVQGIAGGSQGIQGIQGFDGNQGVQGITGNQGIQGVGFTYKGTYVSGDFYTTNDVVVYEGSTYIATAQSYQPPVTPPNAGYWDLLAAQGAQGTSGGGGGGGSQGLQGVQGITGPQGPGIYESDTPPSDTDLLWYDTVNGRLYLYYDSSWVDASPKGGSQGIQGTQGTQGQQGTQGVQGIQGTQGVQGIQGTQAAQGIQGTTGPRGLGTTTGSWTLAPGANTVSLTVPINGTYSIWVRGNIPSGIVAYTATVVVTNTNVPVLGSSYGWYYVDGNQLELTAIPTQIIGTVNNISTATVSTTTANVFTFGITNNSGSPKTVDWGYAQI